MEEQQPQCVDLPGRLHPELCHQNGRGIGKSQSQCTWQVVLTSFSLTGTVQAWACSAGRGLLLERVEPGEVARGGERDEERGGGERGRGGTC
eukprot:COSAG01_NODE_30985_length_605_cov_195.426877_1_plen_91_part_01